MIDYNARADENELFSYCLGNVTVRYHYKDIFISEEAFSTKEPEYTPLDLDKILSE